MLELVLLVLADGPMRWTASPVQSPVDHTALVAAVRADGAAIGHMTDESTGHESLVRWQNGQPVFEVSSFTHAMSGCFDEADQCFGRAAMGNYVMVFRVDGDGDITGTWPISISPGLSGLVGAIGGEAIYRGVLQSGSSDWTTWICRNDGTVEVIDNGGASLFGAHVGHLSDGTRVLLGQYKVGTTWNVFLRSLDDDGAFQNVNDELKIPAGMAGPLGISSQGDVLLQRRDASYSWWPLIWRPDTGEVSEGPAVTVGGYIDAGDAGSGGVVASGTQDGQPAIWRWRPGQEAEVLTLDASETLALTSVNIAGDGTVVAGVLQFEPVYEQTMIAWPAGEGAPVPIRERVIGSIAGGAIGLTAWHASGACALSTAGGAVQMRALSSGDVDGDGHVGINDLLALLDAWGPWDGPCGPDLDFNGSVDVDDALQVLAGWK